MLMVKEKPDQKQTNHSNTSKMQQLGLLLISAAYLSFEISLTRIFSVAQFYHFAFMVVSIALLGSGASGTFLAVFKRIREKPIESSLPWLALGTGASILAAYLLGNWLPFDSFSMMLDRKQFAILLLHYAALAIPFFFSGMIIGLLLAREKGASGTVYAVNLLGSAFGCLIAVLAPASVGGEGMVALSSTLAVLAAWAFSSSKMFFTQGKKIVRISFSCVVVMLFFFNLTEIGLQGMQGRGIRSMQVQLSPYKSISYALQNPQAVVRSSEWNAFSRVDVVDSPSLHTLPGLSYRYLHALLPSAGVFVDGDNVSALLPADGNMDFASYLPAAVAFQLRPQATVLVLEPRAGMDVLVAKALGASKIVAVEANPLLVQAAKDIYHLKLVETELSSGRSYLRSTKERFAVIQLSLAESYHPVGSGAYSLGENFRYTSEAFVDMLGCLQPDGLLVVTRWLQEKPSESLRTFALGVTALEQTGGKANEQIVVLRGYNTSTLLVKKSAFLSEELNQIRAFAADRAFDLVYAPDIQIDETNRYNILPQAVYYEIFKEFLENENREEFYAAYDFDVRPPSDDHPFFGHYFKWSQIGEIWQTIGITWQPFGGAGFFVILAILALALLLTGF